MYHVSAQYVDERMINVHYYYYYACNICRLSLTDEIEAAQSDPLKTEEAVDHRRNNNNAKAVVTSPVRSNLCTPLIAVSTAVRSSDTKTMSVAQLLRNN